jgi:putative endonuclease
LERRACRPSLDESAPKQYVNRFASPWFGVVDWLSDLIERARSGSGAPKGVARFRYGRRGERMAEHYLLRLGYRIAARNFRAAGAEIDLVAIDSGTVVFVEVKRRSGPGAGTPEEAVDAQKQERIRRAAAAFAQRFKVGEHPVRFDVIAISGQGRRRRRLEHLKDAF